MVIGSYIWGCLADTKGRKIVLIATLLMDGIVGVASSFVQYFWVFVIFRFFNGFALVSAKSLSLDLDFDFFLKMTIYFNL